MTAPAAAPSSAPIAPAPLRAAPEPQADRLAFAAVLDALPGAAAKAGGSTAERQPRPPGEAQQEGSPRGQSARHSLLNDSSVLASLPFAMRAASMMNEDPKAADYASPPPTAAMNGPSLEHSGASTVAGAKTAEIGRLIGERAFHFGASTIASRALAVDMPFAQAAANFAPPADPSETAVAAASPHAEAMPVGAVPSADNAAAPTAPRAGALHANRVSPARAAAHGATRSGSKPEGSGPPPITRVAAPAAAHATTESSSSGKPPDNRLPDPIGPAAPSTTPTGPFGAFVPASLGAATSFQSGGSTTSAAVAGIAPRATAQAASPAAAAPPVREIDVDLSPGGLEDVSMTMRLAGDKLSVVVRAASSHTLNSIEGARDAIADRLAAIGQTLDSLIVKQTGVNADGNTNGNAASADDGSAGERWRSAHSADEQGSNDALSRRGANHDRSF